MRAVLALLLVATACKGRGHDSPPPSSPAVALDWTACDAALAKAKSAGMLARLQVVLDGCPVCGDWTPLLRWNTPHDKGGPAQDEIEAAMVRCNAFCTGDAKLKFMGTLDDARGTNARTPWRQLGDICKAKVSAVPDSRFVSAPFFALDRIARAAAAHGGTSAALAAELVLPLPASTVVGTGLALPTATGFTATASDVAITLVGPSIYVGTMPHARLGADGVVVDLGRDGVPGKLVSIQELGAAVKATLAGGATGSCTILAPGTARAASLVPVIDEASQVAPVFLGVTVAGPGGWELPGALPVALTTKDANVKVTNDTTVQEVVTILAKQVASGLDRGGIIVQ